MDRERAVLENVTVMARPGALGDRRRYMIYRADSRPRAAFGLPRLISASIWRCIRTGLLRSPFALDAA